MTVDRSLKELWEKFHGSFFVINKEEKMDSEKTRAIIKLIFLIAGAIFYIYVQFARKGDPDEPGSRFAMWLRERKMQQNGDTLSVVFLFLSAIVISFSSMMDETASESWDSGYEQGYDQGYEDGYSESESWHESDYTDGYSAGQSDVDTEEYYQNGYDDGYADGQNDAYEEDQYIGPSADEIHNMIGDAPVYGGDEYSDQRRAEDNARDAAVKKQEELKSK